MIMHWDDLCICPFTICSLFIKLPPVELGSSKVNLSEFDIVKILVVLHSLRMLQKVKKNLVLNKIRMLKYNKRFGD